MDVVCLGEILIDLFPAEVGRRLVEVSAFRPKPGGAPANVAVAVARQGRRSAFIGKVGDDAFGHYLIDVLAREGVQTRGMRVDAQTRTTLAFIAMPDANSAEFVFYRNPGADQCLAAAELDMALLDQTRALHLGSLSLVAEPSRGATLAAAQRARANGALVSFDVNYRPSLWPSAAAALEQIRALLPLAHLVKVNEIELQLLTGSDDVAAGAAALRAGGAELVVVTRGQRGSHYCCAQAQGHVPAFAVDTVDATGCGDAFIAALLSQLAGAGDWRRLLTEPALAQAMRYANAAGALTAMTQGVIPALPTAEQVQAFLLASSEGS